MKFMPEAEEMTRLVGLLETRTIDAAEVVGGGGQLGV